MQAAQQASEALHCQDDGVLRARAVAYLCFAGTERDATARLPRATAAASRLQATRSPQTANRTRVARGNWAIPEPTASRSSSKVDGLQGGRDSMAGFKLPLSPGLATTAADPAAADAAAGSLRRSHLRQVPANRCRIVPRQGIMTDVLRRAGTNGSSRRRKQDSPRHRHTIIAKEYHYDPPVRSRM